MFGLLSKAKPVNETDVIKNAIFDAFLDNCLGVPSVKVDGDDDSISFYCASLWDIWTNSCRSEA